MRYEIKRSAVAGATEQKTMPIEIKSLDNARGEFEGYLAVFGNEDYNGDVIEPGAFKKTLREAQEVKSRTKSAFLYPLLWMHDVNDPCGGFTEMTEDGTGLHVKGLCDLDTAQGRRLFSGMQKGYMAQLSIGYDTIRSVRDQKGLRHLHECRLWEGSGVVTGYAANGLANVASTKTAQVRANLKALRLDAKTASGKTSWPLGSRDAAWDNGAAHGRVVAWATKDDGSLDEAKMKSVHFYHDDSQTDKIGGYKLLFCDVVDGNVKAMPRGVMACSGSHGVDATKGVSSADKSAIKGKISTYYRRMAKQFNDDTLVAPWDAKKALVRAALERKFTPWGGMATLTQGLTMLDRLCDQADTCFDMLGDCTGLNLDPDEEEGEADVGTKLASAGETKQDDEVNQAVALVIGSLKGFADLLTAAGQAFDIVDQNIDTALDMLGIPDTEDDDYYGGPYYGGMMTAQIPPRESKVGSEFSAKNVKAMNDVADSLEGHTKTLRGMTAAYGKTIGADGLTNAERGGAETKLNAMQPEPSATTAGQNSDPEPGDEPTPETADELESMFAEAKFRAAMQRGTMTRE